MVFLPPVVEVRFKNPWERARLRFFGWYVWDIDNYDNITINTTSTTSDQNNTYNEQQVRRKKKRDHGVASNLSGFGGLNFTCNASVARKKLVADLFEFYPISAPYTHDSQRANV